MNKNATYIYRMLPVTECLKDTELIRYSDCEEQRIIFQVNY